MHGIQVRRYSLEMNCLLKLSVSVFSSFLKLELNTLIYCLTLHKKPFLQVFQKIVISLQNQPGGHFFPVPSEHAFKALSLCICAIASLKVSLFTGIFECLIAAGNK